MQAHGHPGNLETVHPHDVSVTQLNVFGKLYSLQTLEKQHFWLGITDLLHMPGQNCTSNTETWLDSVSDSLKYIYPHGHTTQR